MRDTEVSDLTLDQLVMLLADAGPNDKQLVALADLVRRASQAEALAEALEALHAEVEMAESVGVCLPDRVPSLNAGQALARYRGEK